MTAADKLNAAGIVITGLGSTLAMFGIYQQANGYFAFRSREFFEQIYRIVRTLVAAGPKAARNQVDVAAALGKARGEDPGKSLIGFYSVLMGFVLQMTGSALMFAALFANNAEAVHKGG